MCLGNDGRGIQGVPGESWGKNSAVSIAEQWAYLVIEICGSQIEAGLTCTYRDICPIPATDVIHDAHKNA